MQSCSRFLLALAVLLFSSPAAAACQLAKYLELPVTMRGARPIVSAQIDGKNAEFILDSGAFFSTMSSASAQTYGLRLSDLPAGFEIQGVNGSASAYLTTVRSFGLAGITVPNVQFIVGGTDIGEVGVLGQNLLGIGDVEYDFRHGVVRLLSAKGCKVDDLAYWASDNPYVTIPLEPRSTTQPHTIGWVTLNGVRLKALFDTGAPRSVLTLAAARRAGVTPDSPGVVADEATFGIGTHSLRTWTGTFAQLDIGGEAIRNPKIMFSDADLEDADMLIGADFFLTHHVYVANSAAKMLFTYEGGPVFGINPQGASDDKGKPLDLTDKTAQPTDAEGFSRRGAALASSGNIAAAIADFDRAVALDPRQVRYLLQRAAERMANHQPQLAAADVDKALAMDPANVDARFSRAAMRLEAHDPAGAAEDIRMLDRELPQPAGERLQLAGMADGAGLLDVALANDDAWLKAHTQDARRPDALNERCWVLGQLGQDLRKALGDCNGAIRARPGMPAYLDSRGLVRLRMGDLPGALADYNAALSTRPRAAWTLYMRSVVKARTGDAAGANADRKAALAIDPGVAARAAKMGF